MMPKIRKNRTHTKSTLRMEGMARNSALTTSLSPGLRLITRSGRSARSVRKVRSALSVSEALPRYVSREVHTITKSSTFQPLDRYDPLFATKPITMILAMHSNTKSAVMTMSAITKPRCNVESGSSNGESMASMMLDTQMSTNIVVSKCGCVTNLASHRRRQ